MQDPQINRSKRKYRKRNPAGKKRKRGEAVQDPIMFKSLIGATLSTYSALSRTLKLIAERIRSSHANVQAPQPKAKAEEPPAKRRKIEEPRQNTPARPQATPRPTVAPATNTVTKRQAAAAVPLETPSTQEMMDEIEIEEVSPSPPPSFLPSTLDAYEAQTLDWIETRPNHGAKLMNKGSSSAPASAESTQSQREDHFALPSPIPIRKRDSSSLLFASQLNDDVIVLPVAEWRDKQAALKKQLGNNCLIVNMDFASKAQPWQKLSPSYGHGKIPIRFVPNQYSMSVQGIFEAFKLISGNTDPGKLKIHDGKKLHRTGVITGWARGFSSVMVDEKRARKIFFKDPYMHVLRNCTKREVDTILDALKDGRKVVLLEEHTCPDLYDLSKPPSAAYLLKQFLEESANKTTDETLNDSGRF